MAFITLGTASQLQIKVPSPGSTDWATTMQTDTFLKIAQHAHTGAGDGTPLSTASLADDSITGAKIRLQNDEYLTARDNADTTDINLLKLDTSDKLHLETQLSKILLANNTFLTGRNQADSADVDILRIDGGDDLEISPDVSKINMKNDTSITGRNNADSADIDIVKVSTADKLVLGATIVSVSAETVKTSLIEPLGVAITLNDNEASPITTGIVTLSSGESCQVKYKIIRNSVVQHGTLEFLDSDSEPVEEFIGTDLGITFSVASGVLSYTSTSTGNSATMTYIVTKGQ